MVRERVTLEELTTRIASINYEDAATIREAVHVIKLELQDLQDTIDEVWQSRETKEKKKTMLIRLRFCQYNLSNMLATLIGCLEDAQ